ncbi:class I adenylate-forming enzyme family protein [Pseudomonas sp. BGr12]|uniref:class I adenylate-forming enzyme family protein n=1 Tax=Pseudomonas sp. BGr12 TaxID=2936269 RepID=UPI0025599172|nr:class I adenylate-forming enzyme family protein [Pseudomonas sp. BJa5]MDL2426329.1 acyl--CoA ligase [Pseudomonas sp. BJa5]
MLQPKFTKIHAYLTHYAQTQGDVEAWVDDERSITYSQAAKWVASLAGAMLAHDVKPGQRVAVYGKPSPEFMALFLAITSIGCVYVGLNPKYSQHELGVVLDDCEPSLLFNLLDTDVEHAMKIHRLMRTRPSLRQVAGSYLDVFEHDEIEQKKLHAIQTAVEPKHIALLVYTSGSTGTPKGAQLTHKGITFIGSVANQPAHFGVNGQGRTLCNLPINHVGCVIDTCTNSLTAGATIVFQPDFDPDAMLSAIETYRLTSIGGVPAMFMVMTRSARFFTTDYSSLQKVIVAGNSPSTALVHGLQQVMQCTVMNGYGLTEGMGFSTFTDADDSAEDIAGTVGRFDPNIEWRLEDGEIQLRGDWLFAGYFRRADATAEAFTEDGWFRTGDVASLTEEGRIRLVGRLKEMFKSGGYNVYPLEVEKALESTDQVAMAVVVPVPDEKYAEVGYAFLVADPTIDTELLKTTLRERLANYKIPKYFEVVQELPVLPVGKVNRLALKEQAKNRVAATGSSAA